MHTNRFTDKDRHTRRHIPQAILLLFALVLLPYPAAAAPPAPYLVADINTTAGTASADIEEIIELNGVALFRACDYLHGCELWRSDGTATGTQLVKDIFPGDQGSSLQGLTRFNDAIYFSANGDVLSPLKQGSFRQNAFPNGIR